MQLTAELLFVVTSSDAASSASPACSSLAGANTPPSLDLLAISPLLPPDVTYASPDSFISLNLTLYDPDSMLGLSLAPVLPLPDGATIDQSGLTTARIQWQPSDAQLGAHILCFVASDFCQAKSLPACLVVMVMQGFEEVKT